MPGKLTLNIDHDESFHKSLTWQTGDPLAPVNLTGYTAEAYIFHNASTEELKVTSVGPTVNGSFITLGGALGTIEFEISDDDKALFNWSTGSWMLVMITPSGSSQVLLRGPVLVKVRSSPDA
jgi:hypothetical protein